MSTPKIDYTNYYTLVRGGFVEEYFATPIPLTYQCVGSFLAHRPSNLPPVRKVLDMGAGQGEWGPALRENFKVARIVGVDKFFDGSTPFAKKYYDEWLNDDFLSLTFEEGSKPDVIIGNPPFSQAEVFVEHALEIVHPQGHVVALCPLLILSGAKRMKSFWFNGPPFVPKVYDNLVRVFVVNPRPNFIPVHGKTGNRLEVGLFIFSANKTVSEPVVSWLWWEKRE